jgi:hypothetical protein
MNGRGKTGIKSSNKRMKRPRKKQRGQERLKKAKEPERKKEDRRD